LEELRGRTILDDGIYMNLPLLVKQSVLFPGQTLPMTVFGTQTIEMLQTCIQNDKESMRKTEVKKRTVAIKEKAPRKPKLPKVADVDSPVANITVFRKERKTSVDSNKSDSDDFIVNSQHFESPFSSSKNRTRTTLEKMRKLRSQKLADEDTYKRNIE